MQLQMERKIFRPEPSGKLTLVTLLVSTLLFSLLLAVSPALHEQLHQDASQASHQCAITFFQQHHVTASKSNTVIVKLDFSFHISLAPADFSLSSQTNYRFSAPRAPPWSPFLALVG